LSTSKIKLSVMRGITLLLLSLCITNFLYAQQTARKTSYGRGYLEHLPSDYATSNKTYPAIIFLHGSGERGNGSAADLEKVKIQGIPKLINNGQKICVNYNGKQECFIVLSPQQTVNRSGWTNDVVPFVEFALQNYRIDPNRVYLTGLSMGGDGSWSATYDVNNEPNYFAAIAPVSSGKGDYNGAKITAAHKIPVWAIHGGADSTVPVKEGKRPVNGMNSVNANPAPIWTEYAGLGHNAATWDRAYSLTNNYHAVNLYQWFLSHSLKKTSLGNLPAAPAPTPDLPAAPTVNAGSNQTITLPTNKVSITGSATGTNLTYKWTQASGPNTATLSGQTSLVLSASNLVQGTYVFTLTVTDDLKRSVSMDVNVLVNASRSNQAPTVNAGADQTVSLNNPKITLKATASDPDGSIVSYTWTKTWGADATITNGATNSPTITLSAGGNYTFRVTVKDNAGASAFDDVKIYVQNLKPTANAGPDQRIVQPTTTATLDASASTDDVGIVKYQWKQTSGPNSTLQNPNEKICKVSGLSNTGEYVYLLTVTDGGNLTHTDYVKIIVSKASTTTTAARTATAFSLEGTSIVENETEFSTGLQQNYPNPFEDETTIPFTLSKKQAVKLKVYDQNGNEISTLVNQILEEGNHEVAFRPGQSSSSMYIFKLITEQDVFTVKGTPAFR
jgi:poly(3-hydroxybutyrate) depolymerase